MKPKDWNTYTNADKHDYARRLLNTLRGRYIIGQALALATEQLRSVEPAYLQETSNIEDMESLSVLYNPWYSAHLPGGAAHPQTWQQMREALDQQTDTVHKVLGTQGHIWPKEENGQ